MEKFKRLINLDATLSSLYQARDYLEEVLFNPDDIYDERHELYKEYKKLNKIIKTIEDTIEEMKKS